jgi:hypothetical protein
MPQRKKLKPAAKPVRRDPLAAIRPQLAAIRPQLAKGEKWAGIALGEDEKDATHVILLPGELEQATFEEANAWAKKNVGSLPTRQEQALLFANLEKEFQGTWYWSGTPDAGDDAYAWGQDFNDGGQNYDRKSAKLRARAVRRVAI